MWGATRTLDKRKGPGRTASPTEVTGRAEPFPTTIEDGREGWGGIGGRQSTCVRGGVVGGTGVSHPVRDGGGWGQRHCGEGVGERLRVPPIGPGSPHGWSRRPWEGKEPLLRLGRCRGRRRRSGKENRLRGDGARGRGARERPGPHLNGASPRVVEGWPLGATRGMAPAAAATLATTAATTTATPPPPEPGGCRRDPDGGRPECGEEDPPPEAEGGARGAL